MKKYFYLIIFLLCLSTVNTSAQLSACEPNTDFELGDFSYWKFFQGTCCSPFSMTTSVTPPAAATTGRMTITSGTGLDAYGKFPIVAPGGKYSLKLGTNDNNAKADKARYYIHVPAGSTNFALVYRYAIVMQDPGHAAAQQPRFTVTTTDSATGSSSGLMCNQFSYVAGSLPGFSISSVSSSVYYKPWASAVIDLSGYEGRTIIVDFARGDCGLSAHFGYGYIDMSCGLFAIALKNCSYGATTTLSAPPGFAGYKWMDETLTTTLATTMDAVVPTPSVTTTYKVIITPHTGFGCPDTLTTKINISPLSLDITIPDTTVCPGQPFYVKASASGTAAPFTYNWTPSDSLSCINCADPTIKAYSTGNFICTVTDTNGCSKSDSLKVTVRTAPKVVATDKTICFGDTASLSVTGASTYVWDASPDLSCSVCASTSAWPTATGNYIVTGTDSFGCDKKDTANVKVNALPVVTALDKAFCFGTSVGLNVSGAKKYLWSPAVGLSCDTCTSPVASPVGTTTYIVKGTDANNCVNRDTVLVTVRPLPVLVAPDKVICKGDSALLNVSGAKTYVWSPATGLSCTNCSSPKASPAATTSYVVTGTDSFSCVKKDTVIVKVNALPIIVSPDRPVCIGDSVTLSSSGVVSYNWSPATGLSCTDCSAPKSSPSSTLTYVITGTDTNNCVNTKNVKVTVNSLPLITTAPELEVCKGINILLSAEGGVRYRWTSSYALDCDTCKNTNAHPEVNTTYVVTGTDANGCKNTDTVFVKVLNAQKIAIDPVKEICIGGQTSMKVSGSESYLWSPAGNLSCSTCDSTIANPLLTTVYTVIGIDSNTCRDTANVTLVVNPLPILTIIGDTMICENSSEVLQANGAETYTWAPATYLSCTNCDAPTVTPLKNISYKLTGTDQKGCVQTRDVLVSIIYKGPFSVSAGDTICFGESVNLQAKGGTKYLWYPSAGLSNDTIGNPVAKPDTTTNYQVIIHQGYCFTDTVKLRIMVNPIPIVAITGDSVIYLGEKAHLSVQGSFIDYYKWTPADHLSCDNCQNPVAEIDKTSTYVLEVKSKWGCENKDEITIRVKCGAEKLYIPNTFTPNGDGENDTFYPMGSGVKMVNDFIIYNRWGEVVFETHNITLNNANAGWDGTFRGKSLNADVFVYFMSAVCEGGDEMKFKGNISLIK